MVSPRGIAAEEETVRANVILSRKNVVYLKRASASVQEGTGAVIDRSGFLRALVAGFEASGLDVSRVGSEEALAELVARKLKR